MILNNFFSEHFSSVCSRNRARDNFTLVECAYGGHLEKMAITFEPLTLEACSWYWQKALVILNNFIQGIFLISVQEIVPGTFLHLYYALMAAILKMAAKGPIRDGSISKSVHNISVYLCAKVGAFVTKCTIGLPICPTIVWMNVIAIIFVNTLLQTQKSWWKVFRFPSEIILNTSVRDANPIAFFAPRAATWRTQRGQQRVLSSAEESCS